MSRKIENRCVDCGLPCLGESCRHQNVPVDYCDDCGGDGAEYRIDSDDLCETCAEDRIREVFDDLTLLEKAKAVDVDLNKIDE